MAADAQNQARPRRPGGQFAHEARAWNEISLPVSGAAEKSIAKLKGAEAVAVPSGLSTALSVGFRERCAKSWSGWRPGTLARQRVSGVTRPRLSLVHVRFAFRGARGQAGKQPASQPKASRRLLLLPLSPCYKRNVERRSSLEGFLLSFCRPEFRGGLVRCELMHIQRHASSRRRG